MASLIGENRQSDSLQIDEYTITTDKDMRRNVLKKARLLLVLRKMEISLLEIGNQRDLKKKNCVMVKCLIPFLLKAITAYS